MHYLYILYTPSVSAHKKDLDIYSSERCNDINQTGHVQCAAMTLVHIVHVKIIRFMKTGLTMYLDGSISKSHLWQ